jgi:hypothetical protein
LANSWLPTAGEPKVTTLTSASSHCREDHTPQRVASAAPRLCPVQMTFVGGRPFDCCSNTDLHMHRYICLDRRRHDFTLVQQEDRELQ